ncbi:MAG: DUF1385 domain-containing protein [Deltaproteobacteria bacterium]|nr:DUF1385 domain-containing protein [Deltaproteobacteria bacterium]
MSDQKVENGTPARPYIGGQAVLEGVMMRSPASFAIAVRRADGSISIRERPAMGGTSKWSKVPLVRGMVTLVESLKLGSEALRFSAELYEKDLEAAEKAGGALSALTLPFKAFGLALAHLVSRADGEPSGSSSGDEGSRAPNTGAILTIVAVAFLIALPQLLAWGASSLFSLDLDLRSPKFQLLTGFFKLFVVLGYLALIRRVAEIRRVFQYHGAEHKTISTYEADEALVVENARKKTTLHPRCGTTFLVLTVLVSIVVWTALGPLLPKIGGPKIVEQLAFIAMKVPFLPVLAGITFELQRFTARYCLTGPLRALLYPGFLVQKITTIEPDDEQLEIALASMRATLWREQVGVEKALPKDPAEILAFPSYADLVEAQDLRAA